MLPVAGMESSSTKASYAYAEAQSMASDTTEDHRPTPEEYQRLLEMLAMQEKNKAELANKLARSEEDLKKRASENEELRRSLQNIHGSDGKGMACAAIAGVSAGGGAASAALPSPSPRRRQAPSPSPLPLRTEESTPSPRRGGNISRSGSVRRLPWSTPRTPKSARLVIPHSIPKERLSDRYAVNWGERMHLGTANGLGSVPNRVSISCFFKAKARGNGGLRSVKVVHKSHIVHPRLFQQQLSDMYHLEHPNIVRLLDVYEDEHHVFLIFEYLAGPSLLEKSVGDVHFCERDAAAAFKVVLQALAYLHEHTIVHLNLHPENLRYLTLPKRKAATSGSAYNDQLKLLDFGLAVEIKYLSYDQQAVEVPEGQHLPVLPFVGAQASLGERCVAPEFRGAVGKELGSFMSQSTDGGGRQLSPGRCRSESPNKSSVGREDPVSRQVGDAYRQLEACDMWSAGCLLHLLLTGHLPGEGQPSASAQHAAASAAAARKGQQPPSALDGVSSDARELCIALLHEDPRERLTAEEALQSEWLRRCESLQRIHRSQSKGLGSYNNVATPLPEQVRARQAKQHAVARLRKLVRATDTLRRAPRQCGLVGADCFEGEGPPALLRSPEREGGDASEAAGLKAAVTSMCHEAYMAIATARPGPSGASGGVFGLTYAELSEAIEKAGGDLPWKEPLGALKRICPAAKGKASIVSATSFAELLWMATFSAPAMVQNRP